MFFTCPNLPPIFRTSFPAKARPDILRSVPPPVSGNISVSSHSPCGGGLPTVPDTPVSSGSGSVKPFSAGFAGNISGPVHSCGRSAAGIPRSLLPHRIVHSGSFFFSFPGFLLPIKIQKISRNTKCSGIFFRKNSGGLSEQPAPSPAFLFCQVTLHVIAGTELDPLFRFHHSVAVPVRAQIPVAHHLPDSVVLTEHPHQYADRPFLFLGPGVCRIPSRIQSPSYAIPMLFALCPFACAPTCPTGRMEQISPSRRT